MEVLLFNLSLKRFVFKLDSSRRSSPPAGIARWRSGCNTQSVPLAVFPAAVLDGSSLLSDFSFQNFLPKTSCWFYVLAGFTVNECRHTKLLLLHPGRSQIIDTILHGLKSS